MNTPPGGGMGGAPPGGAIGYYTPPAGSGGRPAVIAWYRVYAIVSLLIYLSFAVLFALFGMGVSTETFILFALAIPFVTTSGLGVCVPYKPWGWTVGLVTIALGMFTCLAPFSVILIIFWNRPEVKAAFGRV